MSKVVIYIGMGICMRRNNNKREHNISPSIDEITHFKFSYTCTSPSGKKTRHSNLAKEGETRASEA